jgi:hypothetical protein
MPVCTDFGFEGGVNITYDLPQKKKKKSTDNLIYSSFSVWVNCMAWILVLQVYNIPHSVFFSFGIKN